MMDGRMMLFEESSLEQMEDFAKLSADDKKETKLLLLDIIAQIGRRMIGLDGKEPRSGQYFSEIIGDYTPKQSIQVVVINFLQASGWTAEFIGPSIALEGGCVMIVRKI